MWSRQALREIACHNLMRRTINRQKKKGAIVFSLSRPLLFVP